MKRGSAASPASCSAAERRSSGARPGECRMWSRFWTSCKGRQAGREGRRRRGGVSAAGGWAGRRWEEPGSSAQVRPLRARRLPAHLHAKCARARPGALGPRSCAGPGQQAPERVPLRLLQLLQLLPAQPQLLLQLLRRLPPPARRAAVQLPQRRRRLLPATCGCSMATASRGHTQPGDARAGPGRSSATRHCCPPGCCCCCCCRRCSSAQAIAPASGWSR